MYGPLLTITDSSTRQTYQVNADKYNRATDAALLSKESDFFICDLYDTYLNLSQLIIEDIVLK